MLFLLVQQWFYWPDGKPRMCSMAHAWHDSFSRVSSTVFFWVSDDYCCTWQFFVIDPTLSRSSFYWPSHISYISFLYHRACFLCDPCLFFNCLTSSSFFIGPTVISRACFDWPRYISHVAIFLLPVSVFQLAYE